VNCHCTSPGCGPPVDVASFVLVELSVVELDSLVAIDVDAFVLVSPPSSGVHSSA
jgi:hypothetical protein